MTYSDDVKAKAILSYDNGNSTYQVAKELGMSYVTVLDWVRKTGTVRTKSEGLFLGKNGFPQPKGPLPEELLPTLDGMMLGDLGLRLPRGVINTRAQWDGKYLQTAEAIKRELPLPGGWSPPKKVIRTVRGKEYIGYYIHSHCLPMLNEHRQRWYPEGIKVVPRDIILEPDIMYWEYVMDGSLDKSDGRVTFCTNGFTWEDVEFLCSLLPLKDWEPRIHNCYGKPMISIPRCYVPKLLAYIGPCHNPEYAYKWRAKPYVRGPYRRKAA